MEGLEACGIQLVIPPSLAEKMDRALISPEDARRTIGYCEATGVKLLDDVTGAYAGHLKKGMLTYWVRYTMKNCTATLLDIYCHRVIIGEDAV